MIHWLWLCVLTLSVSFSDSLCFILICFFSVEVMLLCSILCSLIPELNWKNEILQQGFKGVFVAFLLITFIAVVHRELSLVVAHQSILYNGQSSLAVHFLRVCMLCIPAFFRASVSGTLSCHLILRAFTGNLSGQWLSFFAWCWYTVHVSRAYRRVGGTTAF